MGILCEFCGKITPTVYCRSDAASLCLSCDRKVHGANALSKRHFRTLLCHGCTIEPAAFSCNNHNMCFCHNCDRQSHSGSPQHNRTSINYYSGCPSVAELAELWSCELDGLGFDVIKGSDVPGIGWVDSVGLDGALDSLSMAAGVHAGFKVNLGLWMEPFASPMDDMPSSSQRNSEVNTMIFDSEGSAVTMAKMKRNEQAEGQEIYSEPLEKDFYAKDDINELWSTD